MKQTYVRVECRTARNGAENPSVIYWSDGRKWKIDKVLHLSKPAENEFEGIRYTVLIGGAEKYIFRNDAGWYVVPQS